VGVDAEALQAALADKLSLATPMDVLAVEQELLASQLRQALGTSPPPSSSVSSSAGSSASGWVELASRLRAALELEVDAQPWLREVVAA